ncbi:sigma-70 family RNA polymerase sigma factor [Nocardioides sp. KIGAM211]|uniref:Sigma-70 family RNA polymerase sigma factor n=1 Tax=Nocardioides luti TaxID=2761101 RepID=A0A7X0RIY2_9ACTN|nr:sigma-70 family RNA polymerase sigma factor [Nocardioides luti]
MTAPGAVAHPQAQPAPEPGPARSHRRTETARLLLEAAGTTDDHERTRLEEEAIRLNMGVAVEIARRYHGRGIAGDDLDQVAYLGLVKAVRGFDPTHGSDFLSFAVPTMRGEIRRYFRDFGWTVRPPRSVQELQAKITAAESEMYQSLGRSPRPSELAEHLGVDLDLVVDSLAANGCFSPVSLDAPVGEGERSPSERLGGWDAAFGSAEARVALQPLLATLTERERKILEMRFVGGCTQAEIGAEVGVTQMQVSRLLARILTRLRRRLEDAA